MRRANKKCASCAYLRKLYRRGRYTFFRTRGEKERYCVLWQELVSPEGGCFAHKGQGRVKGAAECLYLAGAAECLYLAGAAECLYLAEGDVEGMLDLLEKGSVR